MSKTGIYTLICLVNQKVYVGQSRDLKQRKSAHFSELRGGKHKIPELQKDFDLYGEDNFLYERLVKCEKRFLYSEEHYWCTMLNAHNPKFGYNRQSTNPYGKGKSSQSTIDKTTFSKLVPVIMLSTDGDFIKRFTSCKEAGANIGTDSTSISSVARGKRSHNKGYIFVYEKDYDPSKDYSIKVLRHKRNVIMYNKDMTPLREFESTQQAADYIEGSQVSVWRALNGVRDTYKGYIWRFGDKINEVSVYNYYKSKLLI